MKHALRYVIPYIICSRIQLSDMRYAQITSFLDKKVKEIKYAQSHLFLTRRLKMRYALSINPGYAIPYIICNRIQPC